MAQELPFYSIPEVGEDYSSGTSIGRMIDGLGFRYHWATEGLRALDLTYRPTPEAQSALETLEHIYSLSEVIANTANNRTIVRPPVAVPQSLEALRKGTLEYLEKASQLFKSKSDEELKELAIQFDRGENVSKFPVWNLINGPIADALYHTGQIVSFRRSSGNPIAKGVNVFLGIKN